MAPPIVLVDTPEDDPLDAHGWVETSVSEDAARDLLAPLCAAEDGTTPWRPNCGPAKRVWLRPHSEVIVGSIVGDPPETEDWVPSAEGEAYAREFWEIPVV